MGVDLAVHHNSLVNELVFVQHVRNPHRRHLPLLHLMMISTLFWTFGLLEPASVPPRALDMPMNCSSEISNLGNFCLLAHVVDSSPGWSDSLSLHFHLDDLDHHCIFDLLVHLGPFLSGSVWPGHVCSQLVHWFAAGSCLEILSKCRLSVLRVLNLLRDFRNLDDLLHHLWFLYVDDLFNDSFHVYVPFERSQPHWDAVYNYNDLLHRAILQRALVL